MHTLITRLSGKMRRQCDRLADRVYRDPLYVVLFVVLSVLLISPVWAVTYLPLGDLPDHAAQLRVITDYAHYKDAYTLNWFTPYLLAYAVTLLFTLFLPITVAIKLTLSLFLLAVPVASAWLIRTLKGNKYWVWTSFPVAFGFSFYWGFFSYIVATPITIAFIAHVNACAARKPGWKPFGSTALFSLLLFFSHALAWVLSLAVAAAVLIAHGHFRHLLRRMLPMVIFLPLVFHWASSSQKPAEPTAPVEFGYHSQRIVDKVSEHLGWIAEDFARRTREGEHWHRTKEMFAFSIGMPPLLDFVLVAAALLVWPRFVGARFSRDWRRYLPLATVIVLFMLVPYWIFNTAYVYLRFSVLLIPAGYFMFAAPGQPDDFRWLPWLRQKLFWVAGFALVMAVLSVTGDTLRKFRKNDADFAQILAAMAPEKQVLQLIFDQENFFRYSPPFLHYGCWYQAEKGGHVLQNFAYDEAAANIPVHYRGSLWPFPSVWDPNSFEWYQHQGYRYDYFLVRAYDSKQYLFHAVPDSVVLIKQQGAWQLYGRKELAPAPADRSAAVAEAIRNRIPKKENVTP